MDVDEAADQVYSAPLAEFVATRDTLAKQATDRGVAARIKNLRKPTVAAWVANQVARQHPDDVQQLVQNGVDMRTATGERDGKRLRELSAQGRDLVNTLLRHARKIASAAGQPMSAEVNEAVNDTLRAAMADPRAADALISGRLTRPLEHVGFGMPDASGASADVISLERVRSARKKSADDEAPRRRAPKERTAKSRTAAKEEAPAEPETGDAEQELTEAEAELEAAEAVVEQLTAGRREARQRVAEVKRARDEAQTGVKRAQRSHDDAEEELERIRRQLEAAEEAFEEARANLEQAQSDLDQARNDVESTQDQLNALEDELDEAYDRAQAARDRRRKARQALR